MPRTPQTTPRARGQRSDRPTAVTRKPPTAAASQPLQGPTAAAALEQASQQLSALWSQWAEQMRRVGEQALTAVRDDAEVEGEAVRHAQTPQQWAGLPIGFVAEQAARWAQLTSQATASLLDVQATLFKDFEAAATQMMAPWFTQNGRIAFGSAQDLVEPPEQAGPMPLLWSAQRIWSESAKVWLHAMSHDLQGEASAR